MIINEDFLYLKMIAHPGFAGTILTYDQKINHPSEIFELPSYAVRYLNRDEIYFTAENLSDETGPFRITCVGNNHQYMQANQFRLKLTLQLQRLNGTKVKYEDVSFINNIGSSLFDTVQVDINNKSQVELTQEQYAHKAYLEALLSFNATNINSLQPRCFLYDRPGLFLNSNPVWKNFGSTNQTGDNPRTKVPNEYREGAGVWERQIYALETDTFEVVTPLSVDFLQTGRLIPPNTSITLYFKRKPHDFYILKPSEKFTTDITDDANKYKIKVIDMKLVVPYITLEPSLKMQHEKFFAEGKKAVLPFQKVIPFRKQFPSGLTELSFDNCITGELPKHLVCMMIKTSAFDGTISSNPFIFDHNSAIQAHIRIDNRIIPQEPISMDFDLQKYTDAYRFFLNNIGMTDLDSTQCMITFTGYARDYTMFAWDLSPDLNNNFDFCKPKIGNLDVKIVLKRALGEATTLLVFATYNKILTLDANRDVNIRTI